MGEEAVEPQVEEENVESPEQSEEQAETLELIRGDGSQPTTKKQTGLQKRFSKLTSDRDAARGEASDANEELRIERERNKILHLALEQKSPPEAPGVPNPEDYDDGVNSPEYRTAYQTHTDSLIDSKVTEALNKHTSTVTAEQGKAAQDTDLRNRQTKHYERAEELGAKDYAEVEDKAIEILGVETVNHFIRASDSSEIVLYYLGKNPGEANAIAELIRTDPVKATLQLGRLEAEIKVKPKGNLNPAPDPDEELEGGSPSASNTKRDKMLKQLDELREGGDMTKILAFKRKAKAEGVTL